MVSFGGQALIAYQDHYGDYRAFKYGRILVISFLGLT